MCNSSAKVQAQVPLIVYLLYQKLPTVSNSNLIYPVNTFNLIIDTISRLCVTLTVKVNLQGSSSPKSSNYTKRSSSSSSHRPIVHKKLFARDAHYRTHGL